MPIRTHRGRAAVYRRLWGWPLRSPKHLVLAVVVVGVVVTAVGFLFPKPPPTRPQSADDRPASVGEPEVPTSSSTSTKSPPTFSVPQGPPPPAAPNPEGLGVVTNWGKAWVNHPPGTNSQQWVEGLRPYTTEEYITVMASIDPANVPGTAVAGPPTPLSSRASSMDVRLPTNAGDIEVLVVRTPQGWRVAEYNKVA